MTQPAADILDTLAHVLTTAATALRTPPTETEPTEPATPAPVDASIATPDIPAGDARPTPDIPAGDPAPAPASTPAPGASTLDALAGRLTDPNVQ